MKKQPPVKKQIYRGFELGKNYKPTQGELMMEKNFSLDSIINSIPQSKQFIYPKPDKNGLQFLKKGGIVKKKKK